MSKVSCSVSEFIDYKTSMITCYDPHRGTCAARIWDSLTHYTFVFFITLKPRTNAVFHPINSSRGHPSAALRSPIRRRCFFIQEFCSSMASDVFLALPCIRIAPLLHKNQRGTHGRCIEVRSRKPVSDLQLNPFTLNPEP